MNLDELKTKVEANRDGLKEKSGKMCMFTESRPANMGLIDAMVSTIEAQERRIAELEKKVGEPS